MIGIDTNVLLRLFKPADDARQADMVRRVVKTQGPVFVSPITLVEFVWVLQKTFKLDRADVHHRLAGIVDAPEFAFAFPQATRRAVEQYETGPADFADYLMGELNLAFGCDATLTFDKNAVKNPAFRHLAA
jgi:predicted nucleic-acid-binding protein